MNDKIVGAVYEVTRKYKDPVTNLSLDKNNKNFSIIYNEGRINISINIQPNFKEKYKTLSYNLKENIEKLNEVLSANIILTSEKSQDDNISEKQRFSIDAKNIIAIASGKGGVGKSTFAVNYAVALKTIGLKVGLLDADIYGPSIPRMMGITSRPQANENKKLVPLINYDVKCMSIGFLIDVDTPAIWRGPMVMKALEQMYNGVEWGELDYLIIDLPPGTGDAQLTLAQNSKLTGSLVISTPQDVALIDARKAINMFNKVNIPVLGLIENMSYFICDSCNTRHEIFSSGSLKKEAEKYKTNYLGELPIEKKLRIQSDEGRPSCIDDVNSNMSKIYLSIAKKIDDSLN